MNWSCRAGVILTERHPGFVALLVSFGFITVDSGHMARGLSGEALEASRSTLQMGRRQAGSAGAQVATDLAAHTVG